MLEEKQKIEAELLAQGWTITPAGNNHGMTLTASKDSNRVTVYSCTYLGAWQALAAEVKKQTK
jgi:hypothetical protein